MRNMTALQNFTPGVILLALLITGCQTESIPQNCEERDDHPQLPTFYTEEFRGSSCWLQKNIESDKKQVDFVITNQADYEKHILCSGAPPVVDFEKYFILAGVYRHHQCALFHSQHVSICNNKIFFRVRMLEQICQAPMAVVYITALEKKYSNLDIEFDVRFKN
jgi:hypothetical protein